MFRGCGIDRGTRRFLAPGQVQVDSAERAEPVEERREQPGGVRGLANGFRENRAYLDLGPDEIKAITSATRGRSSPW